MTTIARYKFGYSSDEWGMNRSLGLIADAGGDVCRFSDVKALQARVAELERQNKDLDRSETQLIQERDEREEVINALCDTVLGTDRYEWSSMYSFDDAVEEVAVKTAVLDKEVSELYALRQAIAQPAISEVTTEYGWLVENGKQGDQLRYRTWRDGMSDWTADHNEATRYCRRIDAEKAHAEDTDAMAIVEHAWHGIKEQAK